MSQGGNIDNQAAGRYQLAGQILFTVFNGIGVLSNEGTIEKTAGTGTANISVIFNNNAGTLQLDSGTLDLNTRSGDLVGGNFVVAAGALLDLVDHTNGNVISGRFTGSGAGTVLLGDGQLNVGPGGATFDFPAGLFQWGHGILDLDGQIATNTGTITVADPSSRLIDSSLNGNTQPGTLVNQGTIVQQDGSTLGISNGATLDNQAAGRYLFAGSATLGPAGPQGVGGVPTLSNEGLIAMTAGSGTSNIASIDLENPGGTIEGQSGTLVIPPPSNNTGIVEANGGNVSLRNTNLVVTYGSVITSGTWIARGGSTLIWPVNTIVTNKSIVILDGAGSTFAGLGSLFSNTGALTVTGGATLTTGGNLYNTGAITIGPGSTLTVPGNYTQSAAAILDFDLGGAPASGQFGTLAVTGSASLGGLLRARLVDGYVPVAGDSFAVASFSSAIGGFSSFDLPETVTATFRANVSMTGLTLSAQPATLTATSVHLSSSTLQAPWGQPITLTATVSSATGTPTGSVLFEVDGVSFTRVPLVGGTATLVTGFTIGKHSITAFYISDNSQFANSDNSATPLTETVTPGALPSITVEVGYADDAHGPFFFPDPWLSSPNTVFVGDLSGGTVDSGALLITNNSSAPITINDVTVTLSNGRVFDLWGSNEVPAGGNLILEQTDPSQNFDTTDLDVTLTYPDTYPDGEAAHAPAVNVTLNGVPLPTMLDTGHVLTTGGSDLGVGGGVTESQNWRPIGTTGVGNQGGSAVAVVVTDSLPAAGYTVDPTSISPAPVTTSASQVVWNGAVISATVPTQFQLTGTVGNMAPGEVRTISTGSTVAVTTTTNAGQQLTTTIALSPVTVAAEHIISIAPPAQTADKGATVTYNVTLTNPLTTAATYTLSTAGLSGFTTNLATTVMVGAGQTVTTPLTVSMPRSQATGTQVFTVLAEDAAGAKDSVEGLLTVSPLVALPTQAVYVQLVPTRATAGQGTSATYEVVVTNVGNTIDTYSLAGLFPAGITATFAALTVTVPPGLSNFRDVPLILMPSVGTAPGSIPFSVTATSTATASVNSTAHGTLNVLANGVAVQSSPASAPPGATFQMTVTNTGQVTDTYDLNVGGPAGLVATLETSQVTLAAGKSQVVSITTSAVNFALAGALNLTAVATSHTNPAIKASASSSLTIPTTQGLASSLSPSTQILPVPGTTSFLLLVNNTGNTRDSYTATITSTTGPVTASLSGLDGTPTQTIPLFLLPGLSTGAVLINADLATLGQGTVTVQVQSLSNPSMTSSATGTVTSSAVTSADVALSEDVSPSTVTVGNNVGFTFHVTNNGPDAATGVTLTVPVPTGATFVPGASAARITRVGNNLVLHIGSLALNATTNAAFVFRTIATGTLTISGTETANESDPNTNNDSASKSATVNPVAAKADLALSEDVPPGSGTVGDNVVFTFHVTNNGPDDATGVILTVPLPSGATFVPSSSTAGITRSGDSLVLQIGNLAADAKRDATLVFQTTTAGKLTVSGSVKADQTDPTTADNNATRSITIMPKPTTDGPRVTKVQRFGFHKQPTTLVISFNEALNASRAKHVSNYNIVDPSGNVIRIVSAAYNAKQHTVTLHPSQQLDLHKIYTLTINGHAPKGLTNVQGALLDGKANGQAGSNYVANITASDLVLNLQIAGTPERLKKLREIVAQIIEQQDRKLGITGPAHTNMLMRR